MLSRKKHISTLLFIFLFCIFNSLLLHAKEIKSMVAKETQLDEQIVQLCEEYCQGNKKKGYLKSVILDQIGHNKYSVVGRAALQSKQVYKNYVIYDHTVIINTFGTLNSSNCELLVNNVFIQNDFNNIFSSLLQNQTDIIGRKEIVPDCKKFIH